MSAKSNSAAARGAAYLEVLRAESAYSRSLRESGDSPETRRLKQEYKDAAEAFRRTPKGNPSASAGRAADVAQAWSGRAPRKVVEIDETRHVRTNLADLGGLEELVIGRGKKEYVVRFGHDVRVSAVPPPAGGKRVRQILFVGGNQSVDLRALQVEPGPDKVFLGELTALTYFARKSHLEDKEVPWEHHFGEEGGALPLVTYDTLNRTIELVGGDYFIDLQDYDGKHSRGIRD